MTRSNIHNIMSYKPKVENSEECVALRIDFTGIAEEMIEQNLDRDFRRLLLALIEVHIRRH